MTVIYRQHREMLYHFLNGDLVDQNFGSHWILSPVVVATQRYIQKRSALESPILFVNDIVKSCNKKIGRTKCLTKVEISLDIGKIWLAIVR